MGQKWPKMAIFWPIMPPIDLKIWHKMYLGGFYWFAKFWEISSKIGRFLAEKAIFFADSAKKSKISFRLNFYLLLQYWSYWSNFWYKCSLGWLETSDLSNFWYFVFLSFYGSESRILTSILRFFGQKSANFLRNLPKFCKSIKNT